MSRVVELLYSRRVPHVAALALMSFGFAGCSADMQTRLSQNNLSNPFASQPETTSSVRTPAVERRELPQYSRPQAQYQSQPLPPPIAAPQSYPSEHSVLSGGGRGLYSYAPQKHLPIVTTATVAPRSVAAVRAPAHGSASAGTTIIVGTSDTLDTLSRRYNVSSAAILQANGYKGPRA
ncbi:MAG: peptidoglycan-binding LysM, partial [Bradyrhizobium sp.]|nr:peptidoglycan-binding LysM [Bradyrhizobium sp.]